MKRKILSIVLALTLSLSCITPAMAAGTDSMVETVSPTTIIGGGGGTWKTVFKAVKWLLVKADNSLFYRDPIIQQGDNWVGSSSGSVSFGSGTSNVRRVKFTTKIDITNNFLDVFAQTNVTNWLTGKITIFIEDTNGNEVYGGIVGHNQHIFTSYDLPLGTYTIYYVDSTGHKWDCWIYRHDFRSSASSSAISETESNSMMPDNCISPSDDLGTLWRNATSINPNMVYNPVTQKSYIIPLEDGFGTLRSNALSFNLDTNNYIGSISDFTTTVTDNVLTSQDLVNEFQDNKLNMSVNRLKNYNVGDTVYVRDTIADLVYNVDKDITVMYFGQSEDSCFEWPFAGDLRKQFNIGDELTFKFSVVEEYSTNAYTFETLDYFLDSYDLMDKGTAANIDTYLMR